MTDTIKDAIERNAKGPASATVDGASATAQDISKQIEADQYVKAQSAASKNHLGLRFFKFEAPRAG